VNFSSGACREEVLRPGEQILFGPICRCRNSNTFRVVVRLDDRLESQVLEMADDGKLIRHLCSIEEDVIGIYFDDGRRICCWSGDIYDGQTGVLLETLDFEMMLKRS